MSQRKKKFKAIIFDCDGTIIPNAMNGLPSIGVTKAVEKISNKIHVGIATSRPMFLAEYIMKHLKLSGPSIISGGSQIVDGKTFKILKEEEIKGEDFLKVAEVFKKFKLDYVAQDGTTRKQALTLNSTPKKVLQMAVFNLEEELADQVMEELSKIDGIAPHKIISWRENKRDINVTHISATKHHGILEIARILKIDTHEIIGVGDSYNDFPLLLACGLKVVMENGADDLKAIADYIAPSVEEDGAVDVINRFITV